MVTREKNVNSFVQINEDKELIINSGAEEGNVMVGISFLTTEDAGAVKKAWGSFVRIGQMIINFGKRH